MKSFVMAVEVVEEEVEEEEEASHPVMQVAGCTLCSPARGSDTPSIAIIPFVPTWAATWGNSGILSIAERQSTNPANHIYGREAESRHHLISHRRVVFFPMLPHYVVDYSFRVVAACQDDTDAIIFDMISGFQHGWRWDLSKVCRTMTYREEDGRYRSCAASIT